MVHLQNHVLFVVHPAYGRLPANNRSLSIIDRMFGFKRPYDFFNQPDDLKKHQGVSEKHQGRFSLLLLII